MFFVFFLSLGDAHLSVLPAKSITSRPEARWDYWVSSPKHKLLMRRKRP